MIVVSVWFALFCVLTRGFSLFYSRSLQMINKKVGDVVYYVPNDFRFGRTAKEITVNTRMRGTCVSFRGITTDTL